MRPVRLREVLWLSQRHRGVNSGAGIGTEFFTPPLTYWPHANTRFSTLPFWAGR